MLDIGIVGLDTSHPDSFAPFFRDRPDAGLSTVWDGGTVQSAAETAAFCDRFDARLHDDPEAMAHDVDAALVLTVDWSRHVDHAVPFLEAGVPTLIDKPVAGRLDDLDRLEAASGAGGVLFGGSSVPFHPDLSDRVGTGGSTYAVGYNDPFYYGAHVVDATRAVAGSDWDVVRPSDDPGQTVDVWFEDGGHATVRVDGPPDIYEFGLMNVADDTFTTSIGGDDDKRREMYDSYLQRFLEVCRGETSDRDEDRILDGATLLLAVHAALDADRPVTPTCRTLGTFEADSAAFVAEYVENRS